MPERELAATLVGQRANSREYRIAKARLKVLMDGNPSKVADELKTILQEARSADSLLDRYALVLALMKSGRLEEAERESGGLLGHRGEFSLYIQLQRAELDLLLGRDEVAIERVEKLRQSYLDNYVLVLEYARLLIQAQRAKQARKVLEDYLVFARETRMSIAGYRMRVKLVVTQ